MEGDSIDISCDMGIDVGDVSGIGSADVQGLNCLMEIVGSIPVLFDVCGLPKGLFADRAGDNLETVLCVELKTAQMVKRKCVHLL